MINKPAALQPAKSRRRTVAAKPAPAAAPLVPGRIAFAGSAKGQKSAHASVYVQSLCWPIVPSAWASLTQAWEIVRSSRAELGAASAPNPSTSWIRACAPQLGAPFRDTTAEESSVAALLTRTPMEIAVAIVDARASDDAKAGFQSAQPQALSNCLATYSKVVRIQKRGPCALVVSRTQGADIDQQFLKEFAHCRTSLSEAEWLNDMQLRFWNQSIEPLPLELAQVIAAAVLRYRLDERAFNPIFEAVLSKMVHNPFPYRSPAKAKRR